MYNVSDKRIGRIYQGLAAESPLRARGTVSRSCTRPHTQTHAWHARAHRYFMRDVNAARSAANSKGFNCSYLIRGILSVSSLFYIRAPPPPHAPYSPNYTASCCFFMRFAIVYVCVGVFGATSKRRGTREPAQILEGEREILMALERTLEIPAHRGRGRALFTIAHLRFMKED